MHIRSAHIQNKAGFSFVELIIVSALITIVFGALFAGVQLMVSIIGNTKAEAGARSIAVSQIEYIRSLPYLDVGTVSGIPSGTIPQTSTTTLNGITYTIETLIQYLDRPEDGFGVLDDNGITEDSKVVKVEVEWVSKGEAKSITLVTDIIPQGIESTAGGGTLFINVFDANVQPVSGAEVHVYNNTGTSTIDVTVLTNANGIANFPGAPAMSGYQLSATKAGYSTDRTYSATATNTSPNPPHISVSIGAVSTVNFFIDELSDLTLRTISTPVTGVYSDSFSNDAGLVNESQVVVSGGDLLLADSGGVYSVSGTAFSASTTPALITNWESFDFEGTSTSTTEYRIQLYSVSGAGSSTVYTLVPDSALPNNSIGFVNGPVDITGVNAGTYPSLALGVTLTTSDTSETPLLHQWSLTHIESESPVSGITVNLESSKSIGTYSGNPVLKYTGSATTDGSGEATIADLEWDAYDIMIDGDVEGYDIKEAYAPLPYALNPGVSDTLTLVLEPHSANSLRVTVVDIVGTAIPGASVHLYNGTFDQTQDTSIYGQTFFGTVASATNYTLDVSASGYDPSTQSNVSVTGTTDMRVVLGPEGSGGSGTSTPPTATSTYLAGYDTRIPISIVGSSLFGSVTDFPMYLDLSDLPASFFSSVQSDGDDIRITESDGLTEVPREIVSINTGSNTGEVYFKAPSLLISTTTTFYIYYGHATATDYADTATYGRNNVWSNGYRAVYHFEEDQSGTGTGGLYVDATGNAYDGDDYVSATGKSGKMGSGQEFDNALNDRINLPYQLLDGQTDITTSFWFRSGNSTIHPILSGANSGEANEYLLWLRGDTDDIEFFSHGNPREAYNIADIYSNTWYHITSVREDSTNLSRLYLNGTEDNESPSTANVNTLDIDLGGLMIGQDQDSVGGGFQSGQELDGYLDELRISSTVRSGGWITNEYVNQNNASTFYSIGSVETE